MAALGLACLTSLLRLPGEIVGGITVFAQTGPFESLSDISFDVKPCSLPAQGCFLTTLTLHWGT